MAVAGVGVDLHPPRHTGPFQPGVDVPLGDPQRLAHGDGGQGVFHVEQPRHGEAELPLIPPGAHLEQDVAPPLAHLGGEDIRLLVPLGEGVDRPARLQSGGKDAVRVAAVQVDTVDRPLPEDPQLGGEVVLKVGVLDRGNMVVADVEKACGGKVGAQGAVVLQRLTGHLHGQVFQPGLDRVVEVALQVQSVGGGDVGLEAVYPVVGVDGGDDAALRLVLLRQTGVQDILQVVGCGGFPLGPRQADDLQLPGGVVIKAVSQGGDGAPHAADQEAGQGRFRIRFFAHIGDGPLLLGHLEKFRLEVGPLAEEQRTGDHLPGVVGHQLHGGGPVQGIGDRRGQQGALLQQGDIVVKGVFLHRDYLVLLLLNHNCLAFIR